MKEAIFLLAMYFLIGPLIGLLIGLPLGYLLGRKYVDRERKE